MKKYTAIFMAIVMSFFCILPCNAQVVDDKEHSITFELSDAWTPVPGETLYVRGENDENRIYYTSKPSNPPFPVVHYDKTVLDEYFSGLYGAEAITQRLNNSNNVGVTVKIQNVVSDFGKGSSGQVYYMYNVSYIASAPEYDDMFESTFVFLTIANGREYYFIYSSENPESTYTDFVDMMDSMEYGNDYIEIYVDDNQVFPDSAPVIVNGRTLVPIRAIAEAMGYTVDWVGEEQKVVISDDNTTLEFVIGSNVAYKNSTEEIELDVPAEIYSDRTYLPLRAVGEALGAKVEWDGDNIAVDIMLNK